MGIIVHILYMTREEILNVSNGLEESDLNTAAARRPCGLSTEQESRK